MGSKKNAWLKFDDAKKQEIFIFVKDIRNIYQIVKQKENQLRKLFL